MIEWQFEHFKTFTPYKTMQQAAAALMLFEGESTDGVNPKMGNLTEELTLNTGHPAWMPDRDNGNLSFNSEGSVFRNKARLFSMFYICVPPDLLKSNGMDKQIVLTPFGKALAKGEVSEEQYYRFIITRFQYPHPAYSDYEEWKNSGVVIRPLLCIIKTMVVLFEKAGIENSYLTPSEIYRYLQNLTDENCDDVANLILQKRSAGNEPPLPSANIRKISEMLAFLSIAGYVYIDSTIKPEDRYRLNLVMRHPKENTLFFLQRTAGGAGTGTSKTKVNIIEIYKSMWEG